MLNTTLEELPLINLHFNYLHLILMLLNHVFDMFFKVILFFQKINNYS